MMEIYNIEDNSEYYCGDGFEIKENLGISNIFCLSAIIEPNI